MVTTPAPGSAGPAASPLGSLGAGLEELEPFTRLDRSLLWSINADYWRAEGHHAFLRDAVPYYATSDGALSHACARFLADWAAIAQAEQLTLVELGPGSGLFARGTLRAYRDLQASGSNLPTLRYVAVDVAESMAQAMVENGVLPVDGVDFAFAEIDVGRDPQHFAQLLAQERDSGAHVLVAANYLLDSLPSRHFRRREGTLLELEVSAARRQASPGSDVRRITLRQRFVPIDRADPMAALAAEFLPQDGDELTLNSGALGCIGTVLDTLGGQGLMVFNDYAGGTGAGGEQPWQSFGGSIAAGLHFASVDRFIEMCGARSVTPHGPSQLVCRLAGLPDEATSAAYARIFSMADARYGHGRVAAARRAHAAGQTDDAIAAYESALASQPGNWGLQLEVAGFAVSALRRHGDARILLAEVLAANPISTAAMNLLGDCDYAEGEIEAAARWYEKAEAVAGGDARARLNLAYCAARQGRLEPALQWIAGALAADRGNGLTAEILERQSEIIGRLASTPPGTSEPMPL